MIKMITVAMMTAIAIANGANVHNATNLHYYSMATAVIDVNENTDSVTGLDFNGNEWGWEGISDWEVGDVASLIMCDNGTPNYVYDDIIINENYSGWVSSWGYDIETGEPLATFY